MNKWLRAAALTLLGVFAAGASSSAHARLAVNAINSAVTEQDHVATATFKLQVTNQEDHALLAMRVVFEGGIEVVIGDVAANSTVTSGGQKFMFDTTNLPPTRSFPVPVTVKFTDDGVETSMTSILALKRAE